MPLAGHTEKESYSQKAAQITPNLYVFAETESLAGHIHTDKKPCTWKTAMFTEYVNIQINRVKSCPQSGMLGENVISKLEDVLKHLTAMITKSTQTQITAQITPDNPFAGIPGAAHKKDFEKALKTAKKQIDEGTLIIPELLIDTLKSRLTAVTDSFLEMLSRIDEKRDDICNALTNGKQYRIINDIDLEAGDTHNNGRNVAIIHTDAGKIVYKPHDMRGDEQIYMLAKKFFNEFVGIPKSIAFGDKFGVCEFIEKRPANGHEEAQRFWYSLGWLTLFAKLFGSTDLHNSNLLARSSKAYIIDLETVFNPVYSKRENVMRHSPLDSLIFPCRTKDYEFSIMMRADEKSNLPIIDGNRVNIRDYIETFKTGYHDAYANAVKHRDEIAQTVRAFPPCIPVRIVMRATRFYGEILRKLYHHSVFISQESMNQNFNTLSELLHKGKRGSEGEFVNSELNQLKRGDVPYFYTYIDSLALYGEGREIIPNRFTMSALEHILDTLYAMNDKDELFDLTCIDRAIRQYPELPGKDNNVIITRPERKGVHISADTALNEAKRILDEIWDLKIQAPDGRLLWGYVCSGNGALAFSDYSLYNGFTGMAVFACALAYITGSRHHRQIAGYLVNAALNEISELCERLHNNHNQDPEFNAAIPIGEASGLDGVLKGLAVIKKYCPDEKLDELCREILALLENTDFARCNKSDIITGVAGVISTLCRFDEYRKHENIIRSAAERLLELKNFKYHGHTLWQTLSGTPRIISGGGHGMAGIAQALLMAGDLLGDDRYISAAGEALNYELENYRQYSAKFGTWADMRDFPPTKYMHGFCYGAPGIGIVLQKLKGGGELVETLKRLAGESVDKLPLNAQDQLCCGNGAVIEYYMTIGDYNSAGETLAAIYERRQREGSYRYNSYTQTGSLFYGLSGTGYEMLRYAFPDKIISVL
ncbi:MAG: type 2 lantipeptide synthetase LanM [Synergistaceae bacterium]|nr:type 2 lantipeptide synthetase LanM [Synergistaceae bacterium]